MTKDSTEIKQIKQRTLKFSVFWSTIAAELGNSRITINSSATGIRYFLSAESDHRDFLKKLIIQSYKRCHCYHLHAPFDVNVALDVLGETSASLKGNREDDLLDMELLEEIAWLIGQHFSRHIKMPPSMIATTKGINNTMNSSDTSSGSSQDKKPPILEPAPDRNRSAVIDLSASKIRKANQQL